MISPVTFFLANAAAFAGLASALPTFTGGAPPNITEVQFGPHSLNLTQHHGIHERRSCSGMNKDVNVVTAGGSLAVGFPSQSKLSAYVGYRDELTSLSTKHGIKVNYVGSGSHAGTSGNTQKWVGTPGMQIWPLNQQIVPFVYNEKPNVIIITAGTADILFSTSDNNYSQASGRMDGLLTGVFGTSSSFTVILSAMPLINDKTNDLNRKGVNDEFKKLVDKWTGKGYHILWADVSNTLTSSDLIDVSNPTEAGYKKLAAVYADSLETAACNGWF